MIFCVKTDATWKFGKYPWNILYGKASWKRVTWHTESKVDTHLNRGEKELKGNFPTQTQIIKYYNIYDNSRDVQGNKAYMHGSTHV